MAESFRILQGAAVSKNGKPIFHGLPFVFGAGYGTRTRRLLLGKQSLYRMS